MMRINDFYENRDKIIVIFLIGINLIFFYFCCILPYNKFDLEIKNIEKLEVKLKKINIEKEQVEKIYKDKEKKETELKEKYDGYRNEILQKSFKNISEFEKLIYEKIKKYGLEFQVIGRVEKEGAEEKEGKIYISYEILGKEKGIKNFVAELESGNYLISITETPVYFDLKDEECKIKLKIAGYVLDLFIENSSNNFDEIKKKIDEIKIISFEELNILEKKILNINKNRYLLLKYKKGGRDIFFENEVIEKDGQKYKVKITDEGIILDSREIK